MTFHYVGNVESVDSARAVFVQPDWQIEAVSVGTDTVAAIYADAASTPIVNVSGIANRARANSFGEVSFYITEGDYDLKYYNATGTFVRRVSGMAMYGAVAAAASAASAAAAATSATTATTQAGIATTAAVSVADVIAPIPASPAGIWPEIQDSDSRILVGFLPGGAKFDPGGATATDITTLQARATALEGTVPTYPASPGGVFPSVLDGDGRIMTGFYGGGAAFAPTLSIVAYASLFPNDARFLASDYSSINERSVTRLRPQRPLLSGDALLQGYANPSARVGWYITNATKVTVRVGWNTLLNNGASSGWGSIMVDGVEVQPLARPTAYTVASESVVDVVLDGALHLVEVIWPYSTGMDLLEVRTSVGAAVAPAVRPSTIMATCGDSITNGSVASKSILTWPHLLANAKSYQLINLGYGSRKCVSADATTYLTGTGASRVTYMIGYNDWIGNTALATFQANVLAWLQNARAALPSAKIYMVTPLWSPDEGTNNSIPATLANYRTQISTAFATWADGNSTLVNGMTLCPNSGTYFGAGPHPNDAGMAQVATALTSIIT